MADFKNLSVFGHELSQEQGLFWLSCAVLALVLLLARNIVRTRPGRALQAIRDRDITLEEILLDWEASLRAIADRLDLERVVEPVGHRLDRIERRARGIRVPGQVGRKHRVVAEREEPGLQVPYRVVAAGAVQEDHGGPLCVEGPAARRRENALATDVDMHGQPAARFAATAAEMGAFLLDGRLVNACLVLGVEAEGREITTVEGLADWGGLHPIQQAFLDADGYQCGFCTPGQIMSGVACIAEGHAGSPGEIRQHMSGNICRCGAYVNIVAAIEATAQGAGR